MIAKFINSAPISATDKKAISDVRARVAEIGSIAVGGQPSKAAHFPNWRSRTHLECDEALAALQANPSIEAREKYHRLFIRAEESVKTAFEIGQACQAAAINESAKLAPVVSKLLDHAAHRLETESSAHRAILEQAAKGSTFGSNDEIHAHDAKISHLKARLEAERIEAVGNPVGWMEANGYFLD